MKKLQIAVAAASLFAAASATMAASISQSGLTIAREAVSANVASTQTLRAPTVSYNFDNGPTANANSTQDFNVTLTLGGDGDARWNAASATYKTVSAVRRNNGNLVVPVVPASATVPANKVAIVLLSVDVVPSTNEKTFRYKFRLVNNTAAPHSIGDLQLAFNGQNPGDGTAAPYDTGLTAGGQAFDPAGLAAANSDYQLVKNLNTVVNAATVTTGAGVTGDTDGGCGEPIRKVIVVARNYIGSGDGVEGESAGLTTPITNSGYIQFATALRVVMDKGVAVDRNTDPLNNNNSLVANGLGLNDRMALGTIQFANRSVDGWDISQQGNYYKFSNQDLNDTDVEKNGNVDVSSLTLNVNATNGFVSGVAFRLSNSPTCADTGGVVFSSAWVTPTLTNSNKDAAVTFNLANLAAAFDAASPLTNVSDATAANFGAPFSDPGAVVRTSRAYVCMSVPGNALIPQSRFTGTATLNKSPEDNEEQANVSCPAPLAGLGGGIKIDVRNYIDFSDDSPWTDYIRVINNSELVTADVTVQYILENGKYGKWVSLGTLAPREAKFFSNKQIRALMATSGTESHDVNAAPTGQQTPAPNTNSRLRVSSEAASTLRVQNYSVNTSTGLLNEMSASQGADFVNVEASQRDHIDQDAQTGIKK